LKNPTTTQEEGKESKEEKGTQRGERSAKRKGIELRRGKGTYTGSEKYRSNISGVPLKY
jgi:hypothetical protein